MIVSGITYDVPPIASIMGLKCNFGVFSYSKDM